MGAAIRFSDRKFARNQDETVLDCLLREQLVVPHSCKSGVCQSCLLQAVDGAIPEKAQIGLKPIWKRRNLFLACQCYPENELTVQFPDAAGLDVKATILETRQLSHNVLQVFLQAAVPFECEPGQYLTLINPDQISRSYSIANNPAKEGRVELHVRLIPNGIMSGWLQQATSGDAVTLRGPAGNCFYSGEEGNDYPIMLVGTGTGLAPLYGILTTGLAKGHKGNITLFHGALQEADLYHVEALKTLANTYPNFTYTACVLNGAEGAWYRKGNIMETVMANLPEDKKAARLFLCGAPEMVNALKTKAFLSGIASQHIYADAFLPSK